jgi:RHS repeat-associated protein
MPSVMTGAIATNTFQGYWPSSSSISGQIRVRGSGEPLDAPSGRESEPSTESCWGSSCSYGELASDRLMVCNLRLPGQYDERLLGTLGLQGPYYNWNRWYLPSVGRYLELDPIAKEGTFNMPLGVDWYGYAIGNPLRFIDPRGLKIRSGGSQGPDRFPGTTCVEGAPGAACLNYEASIGPCVKTPDCRYKFDANVSASAWREFVSRDAVNKLSRSPGLTIGQHESLHIGDYLSAYAGNKLDALYQSEGFGSLAACGQARSGLAAWLQSYRDGVLAESGGKRD